MVLVNISLQNQYLLTEEKQMHAKSYQANVHTKEEGTCAGGMFVGHILLRTEPKRQNSPGDMLAGKVVCHIP